MDYFDRPGLSRSNVNGQNYADGYNGEKDSEDKLLFSGLPTRDEMDRLGGEVMDNFDDDSDVEASIGVDHYTQHRAEKERSNYRLNSENQDLFNKGIQGGKPISKLASPAAKDDEYYFFQDVQFPRLRSVLWDRTPTGDIFLVGDKEHVPEMVFRRAALASLYHQAAAENSYFTNAYDNNEGVRGKNDKMVKTSRNEPTVSALDDPCVTPTVSTENRLGTIVGNHVYSPSGVDANVGEWVGGRWRAYMHKYVYNSNGRTQNVNSIAADEVSIPVVSHAPSDEQVSRAKQMLIHGSMRLGKSYTERSDACLQENRLAFSSDEYETILGEVLSRLHMRGPMTPSQYLNAYTCCVPLPGERLLLRTEILLPSLRLEFIPVAPLAILSTPLSRQLEKWAGGKLNDSPINKSKDFSEQHGLSPSTDSLDPSAWGFLTLNHSRKAVFLLEDDPMAYEIPVVGVWVRGATLQNPTGALESQERGANNWRSMLGDPLLWSVCLRYIHNENLKEKVSPAGSPRTFLLAIYPRGQTSPFPQFIECNFSLRVQSQNWDASKPVFRTFSQLECLLEVDVSHRDEAGTADTIKGHFYHVEDSHKLQAFEIAMSKFTNLLGDATGQKDPNLPFTTAKSMTESNDMTINRPSTEKNHVDSVFFREPADFETNLSSYGKESDSQEVPVASFKKSSADSVDELGKFSKMDLIDPMKSEKEAYPHPNRLATVFATSKSANLLHKASSAYGNEELLELVVAQQKKIDAMEDQISRLQQLFADAIRTKMPDNSEPHTNPNSKVSSVLTFRKSQASWTNKDISDLEASVESSSLAHTREYSDDEGSVDALAMPGKLELETFASDIREAKSTGEVERSSKSFFDHLVHKEHSYSLNPTTDKTDSSEVLEDKEQQILEKKSLELTEANTISDNLMDELGTEYGIPRITVSGGLRNWEGESYHEEDVGTSLKATDEEDHWLARIEEKYLRQIRQSE